MPSILSLHLSNESTVNDVMNITTVIMTISSLVIYYWLCGDHYSTGWGCVWLHGCSVQSPCVQACAAA